MRYFLLLSLVFIISCGEDVPRPVRDSEVVDLSVEEAYDLGLDVGLDLGLEQKETSLCEKYDCSNLIDTVDIEHRGVGGFQFEAQPFEFDMG